MRIRSTFLPGFVGLLAALAAPAGTSAAVLHVPADFPTIQQALDAASATDTVLVAPGRYVENLVFPKVPVTLLSSHGYGHTTLDGNQNGPVVSISGGTRQTMLSGFTITNGHGGGSTAGGVVIYGGEPIIARNRISENAGSCHGGGVMLSWSAALLYQNIISGNDASSSGSGGGGGGGIRVGGNPCPHSTCITQIIGNIIEDNVLDNCSSGGGIYLNSGGHVRIVGNVIKGNSVEHDGGAITAYNDTNLEIENNLIVANRAGVQGGALFMTLAKVINNTIVDNIAPEGSAVFISDAPGNSRLANNLITSSHEANSVLVRCAYANPDPIIPLIVTNNVYSKGQLAFGGDCTDQTGTQGNISQAPHFLDDEDFRLAASSPGIDIGSNFLSGTSTDLLGAPRIFDGDGVAVIDIGAYELGDFLFDDGFEWDLPDGINSL